MNVSIKYLNYDIISNNLINFIPTYYHRHYNTATNKQFMSIINKFTINDMYKLKTNKITKNVLNLLNDISSVDLVKLINEFGYYLINLDILCELFIPFNILKIDNKIYNISMCESFFDDICTKKKVICCSKTNTLISINKTNLFKYKADIEFTDLIPTTISFDNTYYSNKPISIISDFYIKTL